MCDCFKQVNEQLEPLGDELSVRMMFNFEKASLRFSNAIVATNKKEGKRGKPTTLFASYCPFCGEKYEDNHAE